MSKKKYKEKRIGVKKKCRRAISILDRARKGLLFVKPGMRLPIVL